MPEPATLTPNAPVQDTSPAVGFEQARAETANTPNITFGNNVDFSSFEALKAGTEQQKETPTEKPTDQESKDNQAPTGEQTVETTQVEAKIDPKEETAPIVLPNSKPGRDYSGFDDNERKLFRGMSNEAYDKLAPIYREYKEVKTKLDAKDQEIANLKKSSGELPSNYFSHPEAYTLSSEYKNTKNYYDKASLELQHWEEQLANVESGKPWRDLDVDKKGNYVTSNPIEITDNNRGQVKSQLLGYITQARLAINESVGKLKNISTSHVQRAQALTSTLKQKEEEFFPAYKDTTFKGWSHANYFLENLPQEIKDSNPLSSIAAKLYATVVLQNSTIAEMKQQASIKQEIKQDQRRAGPTGSSFTGGTVQKQEPGQSWNDWEAIHAQ